MENNLNLLQLVRQSALLEYNRKSAEEKEKKSFFEKVSAEKLRLFNLVYTQLKLLQGVSFTGIDSLILESRIQDHYLLLYSKSCPNLVTVTIKHDDKEAVIHWSFCFAQVTETLTSTYDHFIRSLSECLGKNIKISPKFLGNETSLN